MTDLSPHYRIEFANAASLLLQQKVSKLRSHVKVGSYKGESASPVDQYGTTEAKERTARAVKREESNVPLDRRWMQPNFYDWSTIVDKLDTLQTISDPQNPLTQAAVAAFMRGIDKRINAAFWEDAKTGKRGESTTSFLASQIVAVTVGGAASRLNVEKLKAAKKKLMANEVDLTSDEIICIVNAEQHDALLGEVQITSAEYNGGERPVLKDGIITRFLGINFHHYEGLTTVGGNNYVPVYAKSGIELGIWDDMKTSIDRRVDLEGNPIQISADMSIGATRLEEKKIVRVLCDDGIA